MSVHTLKRNTLATVPEEKAFFAVRGDRIMNIKDLANCIESLTDEEFRHHVHPESHSSDWAEWAHHVLHNEHLARDMNFEINLQDKVHLVRTIRDHVAWLESH